MRDLPVLLLVLSMLSCTTPREDPTPAPVAAIAPPATTSTTIAEPTPVSAPAAVPPRCEQPRLLSAEIVATRWPTFIGQHVRLRMRIERTIDLTLSVGVSAGQRFAIVLGPDAAWTGEAIKPFTVTGSRAARLGGRTQLPELLLDEGDSCPQ